MNAAAGAGRGRRDAAPAPRHLYVHVPFCAVRCDYCEFYSVPLGAAGERPGDARAPYRVVRPAGTPRRACEPPFLMRHPPPRDREALLDRFVAALVAEWERERARLGVERLETVFVGGGTPSLLGRERLERLLEPLEALLTPRAEITLETNPERRERHLRRLGGRAAPARLARRAELRRPPAGGARASRPGRPRDGLRHPASRRRRRGRRVGARRGHAGRRRAALQRRRAAPGSARPGHRPHLRPARPASERRRGRARRGGRACGPTTSRGTSSASCRAAPSLPVSCRARPAPKSRSARRRRRARRPRPQAAPSCPTTRRWPRCSGASCGPGQARLRVVRGQQLRPARAPLLPQQRGLARARLPGHRARRGGHRGRRAPPRRARRRRLARGARRRRRAAARARGAETTRRAPASACCWPRARASACRLAELAGVIDESALPALAGAGLVSLTGGTLRVTRKGRYVANGVCVRLFRDSSFLEA